MTRDEVILGLECCIEKLDTVTNKTHGFNCTACPYYAKCDSTGYLVGLPLMRDALALLKAQEPRLVTESDFNGPDEYGYIPVWTEEKDGDMYWECIPKSAITDPDGIGVLRYWTSRPTDAQREATPWE